MREKRNFAERSGVLESREVRKKFFLIYEGKNTEDIYFDGISEHRNEIGVNPLIELVPIMRSYSEEGWSNPKKIFDRIQENLQEVETGVVSYERLLNWIMEYLSDEGMIHNNEEQNILVTVINTGLMNAARALVVLKLSNTFLDFAAYAKEGLIKQNLAQKAIDAIKSDVESNG